MDKSAVNNTQNEVIRSYLSASEEEIEASLGRILAASEKGPTLDASDEEEAKRRVTIYFSDNKVAFKNKICLEWDLDRRINSEEFMSDVEIVAAITDAIASLVGALPVTIIAVLIFKRGIKTLCRSEA